MSRFIFAFLWIAAAAVWVTTPLLDLSGSIPVINLQSRAFTSLPHRHNHSPLPATQTQPHEILVIKKAWLLARQQKTSINKIGLIIMIKFYQNHSVINSTHYFKLITFFLCFMLVELTITYHKNTDFRSNSEFKPHLWLKMVKSLSHEVTISDFSLAELWGFMQFLSAKVKLMWGTPD